MRLTLLAIVSVVALFQPIVLRADVVTATNIPDSGFAHNRNAWAIYIGYYYSGYYSNCAAAQEFVPEISGKLTTLVAGIDRLQGSQFLKVSIFTAAANRPVAHLGTIEVHPYDVCIDTDSHWPLTTMDFSSSNVELVAGQHYMAVFWVANGGPVDFRAILVETSDNSFGLPPLVSPDGGVTWQDHVPGTYQPEIGLIVSVGPSQIPPLSVPIDVDPASAKNVVNLTAKNPKPLEVAVLGTATFDVRWIVPSTIALGDPQLTEAVAPIAYSIGNVNRDRIPDLILKFSVSEMKSAGAINFTSTSLLFTAIRSNGGAVFGSDAISSTPRGK